MGRAPFKFGKVVQGINFTNRESEISVLHSNFENLISTIIVSPRRWGKSSLVKKAAGKTTKDNKQIKICFLDLYKVRTEEEFYQQLTQEVLKITASKLSEITNTAKSIFKQFVPKISFNPMHDTEFTIGLDWAEVKQYPDEILNLGETIAKRNKIKLIICIDEFQNLSFFKNSTAFQKKLRANWQNHEHVAYCMYGSKRHMMLEVFTSQSMPFYQFGSLIFLDKISENHWIKYIQRQFKKTQKSISTESSKMIAGLMENHPYYVQQFAHICWLNTDKICDDRIIKSSLDQLLMQLSLLFQNLTDKLSTKQVNFLKAIIHGAEQISSRSVIKKYNLGTSATVNRSKQALIEQEILDDFTNTLNFNDPAYKLWLQKHYFKI